jgi:fumarate hydratase subunit beta
VIEILSETPSSGTASGSRVIRIRPPITQEEARALRIGDRVRITGTIYTARDAAHARMSATLREGGALPFEPEGQLLYYVGPSPARPGGTIGSAGPTTSYRMDSHTPAMLAAGIRGTIGKGERSREVIAAMKHFGAIYLAATGGVGALLAQCVRSAAIIAYEDLGPEAIRKLEVVDFPAVVAVDATGQDLYRLARNQ